MKLSTQAARDLQPGGVLKCHIVKGLELRAKQTGKMWLYYYRFAGEQRRPKIGEFPTIGLDDARELAKAMALQVARGEDPSAKKQAHRRAPTVADLWQTHKDLFITGKREPRTIEEYDRNYKLHIAPTLGAMKVCDVALSDIARALAKISATKPVAANRVRDLLRSIFNTAERQDVAMRPRGSNPVVDTEKNPETGRERHITGAEFSAIHRELNALRAEYPKRVAALFVCLMTGARPSEVLSIRRADLVDGVATLNAHKTFRRTGKPRRVYFCRQALAEIEKFDDDGSGLLFGRALTRYNLFTVWDLARDHAGGTCGDLQMRDLRRTFASAAKSGRVTLDQIGELLGHTQAQTTMRYAFLFDDGARAAAQATGDVIEGRLLGAIEQKGNAR